MAPRRRHERGPDLLMTSEVAAILHVNPKTVARWAKDGRLPHIRTLGGHRRYLRGPIEALVRQLTEPGAR